MTHEELRLQQAKQHVKRVRDFLYHLMTYVFVNALMVILDLRAGTGEQAVLGLDWAYWLILFWGFGLAGHAIYVFFGDERARRVSEEERASGSEGSSR